MNVTEHCKRRYVERIKKITNSVEIKEYVAKNMEQIVSDINKMFAYSEFIIETQINGDKTSKRYYIRDDIIFVVDTEDKTIITLYRIDFGFPDKTNRQIVKDLREEIYNLKDDFDSQGKSIDSYVNAKKINIENWQCEIEMLQEQINCFKRKITVAEEEIDEKRKSSNVTRLKLKDYANKLCNSLEYKLDLKELNR